MFKSFAISFYPILPNQIKAWLEVKATDPKNSLGTRGGLHFRSGGAYTSERSCGPAEAVGEDY